ncbi:MAG: MFS transporter [Phycisphaerae bacterium]|nr:MFS transporter [Phycisphaerae bacterium]
MFGMDSELYLKLSAMMFLEFAVWGAWYPVLAARLLGPLKFTGKQTGWIYAALPLGCIFMPLVAGQVADRWVNTEFILAGAHLAGTLLLFIAAWKRKFTSLFGTLMVYALFYAATLPLVNSLMFRHLAANGVSDKSPYIFMWAPIAWALAGYFLTGWRWIFKTGEEGRDCLVLAAVLSVVMAVVCGTLLPETRPLTTAGASALGMLKNSSFLIFILISMIAPGMMQFYFLGTAQFMQDNGIAPKNVPAAMAIAQAVQAAATLFLLGRLVEHAGYKWTLTVGAASWLVMYIIYVMPRPAAVIAVSQAFHGLAYVFFIIAGQMFAGAVAPEGAGGSMQGLVFTAQSGIALFLGTQFAGIVMDKCRVEGKFQWQKLWMVPGVIMLACVLALILLFKGTIPTQ